MWSVLQEGIIHPRKLGKTHQMGDFLPPFMLQDDSDFAVSEDGVYLAMRIIDAKD